MANFAWLISAWLLSGTLCVAAEAAESPSVSDGQVEVVLFGKPGCPYCQRAKAFLDKQTEKEDWLIVSDIDVTTSVKGRENFLRLMQIFEIDQAGVPLVVVGGHPFLGFDDASTTGVAILQVARGCQARSCPRLAEFLKMSPSERRVLARGKGTSPQTIELPFVGSININSLSLPALTVLLAAVDGFNPCAMWVLVFLIGLLVGMQDRLRMWLLGGAFLLTSGVVYFGFLAAWLNVFLFIGALFWVRIAVGLVALTSGGYYLHAFITDAAAECRVTNPAQRQRIMDAFRASVSEKRFLVAVAGIVVLAAAVNLIELLCSAGIPAVYSDILAMNNLPLLHNYLYLLLYVTVFMLDDAAIFVIAMLTLSVTGMTNRYLRLSHLIGGIGMVAIGMMLLFAPDWLALSA